MPISDDYPSAPPVNENPTADTYPRATFFVADEGPTPSLVHAGWDSCSELSEI